MGSFIDVSERAKYFVSDAISIVILYSWKRMSCMREKFVIFSYINITQFIIRVIMKHLPKFFLRNKLSAIIIKYLVLIKKAAKLAM